MSTDLQVVNKALRHLGQFPIETLADNTSAVSRAMKDTLDSSIKAVMGLYNWTANRRTHSSTGVLTEPPDGKWRYRHAFPGRDPDAMVVEGAGTTAANGVYQRDGDLNSKPSYVKSNFLLQNRQDLLFSSNGLPVLVGDSQIFNNWNFYDIVEDNVPYYGDTDNRNEQNPDLVSTWYATADVFGFDAATEDTPTVRRAIWADIDAARINHLTVPLLSAEQSNRPPMDSLLSVRGSDGGYTTNFQVVGKYIYSNEERIIVTYTETISTVSEAPEYLASLIAAHLAMEACTVVTGDGNKYYAMERIYARELTRARSQELRMNPHGLEWMDDSNSSFLQAHRGYSTF